MVPTTQKGRIFVAEPMGDKGVQEVAGIGKKYGKKLQDLGYDKASVLLGKFLRLNRNVDRFAAWLMRRVGMNSHYAKVTSECLGAWSSAFI